MNRRAFLAAVLAAPVLGLAMSFGVARKPPGPRWASLGVPHGDGGPYIWVHRMPQTDDCMRLRLYSSYQGIQYFGMAEVSGASIACSRYGAATLMQDQLNLRMREMLSDIAYGVHGEAQGWNDAVPAKPGFEFEKRWRLQARAWEAARLPNLSALGQA